MIKFHKTQEEAIKFLVSSIEENKKVVGLVGAGGTGKSEILSVLPKEYKGDKELYFAATTNKAVSRLLQVLDSAKTVHSLTTKPKYTPLYNQLDAFFTLREEASDKDYFAKNYIFSPGVKKFIQDKYINLENERTLNDLLSSLNMNPFSEEMFDRYIVNDYVPNSVIIIDEASMLPTKSIYYKDSLVTIGLDVVEKVFQNIILVGDSSQLPPVNGESSFDGLETYELTKNFRSEKDLLEAIQWARDGKWFGKFESKSKNVRVVNGITQAWYDRTFMRTDTTHIVYKNNTRHKITHMVRGNSGKKPLKGEPLMIRGQIKNALISKGEIGIFDGKNIVFENGKLPLNKWDNMDEYAEGKYGFYQFAYAITCHLAQGSAFENVIVHAYDIPHFLSEEEKRKWLYTAISRAKKTITIIL